MVMATLQIRLSPGLVERIDSMVKSGLYSSRSDVIRDAVRKLTWEKEVGTISKKGDSVELIRKIRKELSKEKIDLDEINNFGL